MPTSESVSSSGSSSASTSVITPGDRYDVAFSTSPYSETRRRSKGKERAVDISHWQVRSERGVEGGRYPREESDGGWSGMGHESDNSEYRASGQRQQVKKLPARAVSHISVSISPIFSHFPPTQISEEESINAEHIRQSHTKRLKITSSDQEQLPINDHTPHPASRFRRPGKRRFLPMAFVEIRHDAVLARQIAGGEYTYLSGMDRRRMIEEHSTDEGEAEEGSFSGCTGSSCGKGTESTGFQQGSGVGSSQGEMMEVERAVFIIPSGEGDGPVISTADLSSDEAFFVSEPCETDGSQPEKSSRQSKYDDRPSDADLPVLVRANVRRRAMSEDEAEDLQDVVVAAPWHLPVQLTEVSLPEVYERPHAKEVPLATFRIPCHQCRRGPNRPGMTCRMKSKARRCRFIYCEDCCRQYPEIKFDATSRDFVCPRCIDICKCVKCFERRERWHMSDEPRVNRKQIEAGQTSKGDRCQRSLVLADSGSPDVIVIDDSDEDEESGGEIDADPSYRPTNPSNGATKRWGGKAASYNAAPPKSYRRASLPSRIRPTTTHAPIMIRLRVPKIIISPSGPTKHTKEVDSDGDTVGGYSSEEEEDIRGESRGGPKSSVSSREESKSPASEGMSLPIASNPPAPRMRTLSTNDYLSLLAPLGHIELENAAESELPSIIPTIRSPNPNVKDVMFAPRLSSEALLDLDPDNPWRTQCSAEAPSSSPPVEQSAIPEIIAVAVKQVAVNTGYDIDIYDPPHISTIRRSTKSPTISPRANIDSQSLPSVASSASPPVTTLASFLASISYPDSNSSTSGDGDLPISSPKTGRNHAKSRSGVDTCKPHSPPIAANEISKETRLILPQVPIQSRCGDLPFPASKPRPLPSDPSRAPRLDPPGPEKASTSLGEHPPRAPHIESIRPTSNPKYLPRMQARTPQITTIKSTSQSTYLPQIPSRPPATKASNLPKRPVAPAFISYAPTIYAPHLSRSTGTALLESRSRLHSSYETDSLSLRQAFPFDHLPSISPSLSSRIYPPLVTGSVATHRPQYSSYPYTSKNLSSVHINGNRSSYPYSPSVLQHLYPSTSQTL